MAFDLLGGEVAKDYSATNTPRERVLSGINEWLKGAMGKVGTSYQQRGFGSRIHAPSVMSSIAQPYITAGAEAARKGLSGLEEFEESKRRFDLLKKEREYGRSEAGNLMRRKEAEASKWYNLL